MRSAVRLLPLLVLALAACSSPSPAPGTDAQADVPAVDTSVTDARGEAGAFVCPGTSYDPVFSQSCAGYEGSRCRYGYDVPNCGGRTWTCTAGRWSEEHTDPSASCFDAGPDARPDASSDAIADGGPDAAPANACAARGGICLGSGSACTTGGGTISTAGAGGCLFSDGAGVCCVPPAVQPTGNTCADHGGVCAPIAGCGFVGGYFAPPTCTGMGVGVVCCVPSTACQPTDQVCCEPGGSATFRPTCNRGQWECFSPTLQLMPRDRCP